MEELSLEATAVRVFCLLIEVSSSFILINTEVTNSSSTALNLIAIKFKVSD